MSQAAGLREYRAVLTTPGARGPVIAALLGRLPIAMVEFSLLLYLQRVTGSYARAGLVSASVLVGVAVGAVLQARVIDRIGPTRPLLLATATFAAFVTMTVLGVEREAPTALLAALALGIGVSQPAIGSASRAMWSRLLPPGSTRSAAMTYEAVITEVYFIVGPALSGILIAAPWPGTGLVAGALLMIVGTAWYALTPTMRGFRPDRNLVEQKGLVGALTSPGLQTVAFASLGMGLILGFVEVAVPAAANHAGNVVAGGLLLGLWSISSAIFGLLYGARPWPRSLRMRMPVLLAGFSAFVVLLMIPTSLVGLALLMLLAGTLITPQTAAHADAIESVAIRGQVTESFGWVITAATLGIGLGQAASGQIVERAGIDYSYLVAGLVGSVIATVVYLRRKTIGR
jgi:MFS family permease